MRSSRNRRAQAEGPETPRPAGEEAQGSGTEEADDRTGAPGANPQGQKYFQRIPDSTSDQARRNLASILTVCAESPRVAAARAYAAKFEGDLRASRKDPDLCQSDLELAEKEGGGIYIPRTAILKRGEHQVVLDVKCQELVAKLAVGGACESVSEIENSRLDDKTKARLIRAHPSNRFPSLIPICATQYPTMEETIKVLKGWLEPELGRLEAELGKSLPVTVPAYQLLYGRRHSDRTPPSVEILETNNNGAYLTGPRNHNICLTTDLRHLNRGSYEVSEYSLSALAALPEENHILISRVYEALTESLLKMHEKFQARQAGQRDLVGPVLDFRTHAGATSAQDAVRKSFLLCIPKKAGADGVLVIGADADHVDLTW